MGRLSGGNQSSGGGRLARVAPQLFTPVSQDNGYDGSLNDPRRFDTNLKMTGKAPELPTYVKRETPDFLANAKEASPSETVYGVGKNLDKSGNFFLDVLMNPLANTFRLSDSIRGVIETSKTGDVAEKLRNDADAAVKALDEKMQSGKLTKPEWIKQRKELAQLYSNTTAELSKDTADLTKEYSPTKVAGDVISSGLDLTGGKFIDDLVGQFGKKAVLNVWQRAGLRGLEGMAMGTAGATSYGLSEGKTVGESLTQDAPIGAITGGVLGSGSEFVSEGFSKVISAHKQKLADQAKELLNLNKRYAQEKRTNTLAAKETRKQIDALNESINTSKIQLDELRAKDKAGTEQVSVKDKEAVKFNQRLETNPDKNYYDTLIEQKNLAEEDLATAIKAKRTGKFEPGMEATVDKQIKLNQKLLDDTNKELGRFSAPLPETKMIEKAINPNKVANEIVSKQNKIKSLEAKLAQADEALAQNKVQRGLINARQEAGMAQKPSLVSKVLNKIPGVNKVITVPERLRMTDQGRTFEAMLRDAERKYQTGVNDKTTLLKNFFDDKIVSREEANAIFDAIESGVTSKLKPEQKQIADALGEYIGEFENVGVKVAKRENYVPRVIDPSKKDEVTAFLDGLVKEGKLTLQNNDGVEDIYKMLTREVRAKKGAFEYGRAKIELPENLYVQDAKARLMNYIDTAEQRKAFASVFGPKMEALNEVMRGLGTKDQKLIKDVMSATLYGVDNPQKWAKDVGAAQAAFKLPMAWLKNMTQGGNDFTIAGPKAFYKGNASYMRDTKAATQYAMDSGINMNPFQDMLLETVRRGDKSDPFVKTAEIILNKVTPFGVIEKSNRIRSSVIGREYFNELVKKANAGKLSKADNYWLRELRIEPSQMKNPTKELEKKFVWEHVGKAQFYVSPIDMPLFATKNQYGKLATQFKAFSIQQQKLLDKAVLGRAARGDFGPMARYLGFNVPAGAAVNFVKFTAMVEGVNLALSGVNAIAGTNMHITPRKEDVAIGDVKNAGDAAKYAYSKLQNSGGLGVMSDYWDAAAYSDSIPEYVVKNAGGVTASNLWDLGDIASNYAIEGQKAMSGKEADFSYPNKQAAKFALSNVPGGYIAKQGLYPYDPKSSKFYDLKDKLDLTYVSSADTQEAAKAEREGGMANTNIAKEVARKLYDQDGNEKPVKPKEKEAILSFFNSYGIDNAKDLAKASYDESSRSSKELASKSKSMGSEQKNILKYYKSSKTANEYLKSVGKSLDDYPDLKAYYEMKEK